jgi:beta-fructofuranosidase
MEPRVIKDDARWIWDSWYAQDGSDHHAFFLAAPRALGDVELRHDHASIGHAISRDLREWTHVPDALSPGAPGRFDDRATWTGSVVRDGECWRMFYTGISNAGGRGVQQIGHAVSHDLVSLVRVSADPIVVADPRWYSVMARDGDESFRDPWVFRYQDEWHMLITATDRAGWGCVGHAVSHDLLTWRVRPPLTSLSGFGQLEVLQIVETDGGWSLVFSTTAADVRIPSLPAVTGTWSAPAESPLGPFHLERAEPIDATGLYAGRLVPGHDGWSLLGFENATDQRPFLGTIADPRPVAASDRGTFRPVGAPV